MLISLDWLGEYVELPATTDKLTERLTLAGLNLEGVVDVGRDVQIDLEVTSNRADCLGHIGIAREVSVLWQRPLLLPNPTPPTSVQKIGDRATVRIDCPQLCSRYTARWLRGIKIGPSPEWLARRLQTVGIAVINNVVDVTNYVMLECGQPLHAFDFNQLSDGSIIVRESKPGEKFLAIDHREYELASGTCVIADARRPIALAGVMGGQETEVSATTTELLIEAAAFDPLSVRRTARHLGLHSPSSYRFERGVDVAQIDWASRRCCELILDLAGGELAEGSIDQGAPLADRPTIVLRLDQIKRILGIDAPTSTVRQILSALGNVEVAASERQIVVAPPSWRADLTREVDLIEEVARIHGYERIPEDSSVRMTASQRSRSDRVLEKVRLAMTSCGFDEAMTLSAVEPDWIEAFRVWSNQPPLVTSAPLLRRANCLRQSLVPSLLAARRHNEKLSNPVVELFEIAHVYLPGADRKSTEEKRLLALSSGGDFRAVKGVLEAFVATIAPEWQMEAGACSTPLLDVQRSCQLQLSKGERSLLLGYLGELSDAGRERFDLRGTTTIAEIDLGPIIAEARLEASAVPLSPYPPVSRDLNVVVGEHVLWSQVAQTVREAAGTLLEAISFRDDYRNAERLGTDKKSLLFSILLRSPEATLTSDQADAVCDAIVAALAKHVDGRLRA